MKRLREMLERRRARQSMTPWERQEDDYEAMKRRVEKSAARIERDRERNAELAALDLRFTINGVWL